MNSPQEPDRIGVVIVTYNSADVIADCLECLQRSDYPDLKVVLVDNCSPDNTLDTIRDCLKDDAAFLEKSGVESRRDDQIELSDVTLIKSEHNLGFAGGVNIGLKYLLGDPRVALFWLLNPDVLVNPDTATQYARRARDAGPFGLLGGRIEYVSPANIIQTDGGRVNPRTGICSSIHAGMPASVTAGPDEIELDFISGASMVASRQFVETIGLMSDDYFLYYEEVDWAFRRNKFKLIHAPKAVVRHHGGTSIGSAGIGRKQGSALSNFFNYRNRIRFMRKYYPGYLFTAYLYSGLKVIKLILQGYLAEAHGAARGLLNMPPPRKVRQSFSDDAGSLAFGSQGQNPVMSSPSKTTNTTADAP